MHVRDGWRRRSAVAALTLTIATLATGVAPAAAAGEVDQEQTTIEVPVQVFAGTTASGQTFTVGRAGLLDQVDFALERRLPALAGDFLVEIQTVGENGRPSGTILTTGRAPDSATTVSVDGGDTDLPFVSFPLTPIAVTVGQKLAIVVTYEGAEYNAGLSSGTYAGGDFYNRPGSNWLQIFPGTDLAFRTYVSPPPPPPAPDGLLSGVVTSITNLLPALAPVTNPVRSLLRGLGL